MAQIQQRLEISHRAKAPQPRKPVAEPDDCNGGTWSLPTQCGLPPPGGKWFEKQPASQGCSPTPCILSPGLYAPDHQSTRFS